MELPRIFTLGGKTWTLDLVNRKDLPNDHGVCYLDERLIEIRDDLSEHNTLKTYLHEKLHSYESIGIKLPHKLIYQLEAPLAASFRLLLALNK